VNEEKAIDPRVSAGITLPLEVVEPLVLVVMVRLGVEPMSATLTQQDRSLLLGHVRDVSSMRLSDLPAGSFDGDSAPIPCHLLGQE
jgi:hypothetical protein